MEASQLWFKASREGREGENKNFSAKMWGVLGRVADVTGTVDAGSLLIKLASDNFKLLESNDG